MKQWHVKSFSIEGLTHRVVQTSDGEFHCDCKNFSYRGHKDGYCDHIKKIRHQRMRRHGVIHLRKMQMVARIKTYNHLVKRYVAKHSKLMATNIGRIATITTLYSQLQDLQKRIIKLKRQI